MVIIVLLFCSTVGHIVPQKAGAHFYSATKYAVRALTEGVRHELREIKSHIRVSVSHVIQVHAHKQQTTDKEL